MTDTVEIVGCYMLALWGFGCMQYTTVSRISDIPFQIKPQTMICLLVLQRTIPDQVCKVTPRACTNIGVQVFFGQNFVKTIATWSGFSAKGRHRICREAETVKNYRKIICNATALCTHTPKFNEEVIDNNAVSIPNSLPRNETPSYLVLWSHSQTPSQDHPALLKQ